ncbi:hypothetical protein CHELA40_10869 [Chelatococcus asaccharovorans]|nr:hypothetical protein CHELA40_10869 [Chelatococcus asaccharovorans]CAH1685887.1 hypothetical protein CHELA17_64731 [Chelatococcus asaccharovorans]
MSHPVASDMRIAWVVRRLFPRRWQGKRAVLLAIMLDARGPQAGQAMAIDGFLPAEEFLDSQRITLARFIEAEESASHSSDDFGFATDDPSLRIRRREIRDRQRTAIGPDDVFHPRAVGFGHDTLTIID